MSAPVTTEKSVQAAVLQWLNTLPGFDVFRQNRGAKLNVYTKRDGKEGRSFVRFGERGQSDLSGVGPTGVRVDIEIKKPGEVPTLEQSVFLMRMCEKGAIAFYCDDLRSCVEKMRHEF